MFEALKRYRCRRQKGMAPLNFVFSQSVGGRACHCFISFPWTTDIQQTQNTTCATQLLVKTCEHMFYNVEAPRCFLTLQYTFYRQPNRRSHNTFVTINVIKSAIYECIAYTQRGQHRAPHTRAPRAPTPHLFDPLP